MSITSSTPVTTDRDLGRKRILRDLRNIKKSFITIGIHSDEKTTYPRVGGTAPRVQDVGNWHEFGIGNPERSFLRSTFDVNRNRWRKDTRRLYGMIIKGTITPEMAMRRLGFEMKNEVQNTIEKMKIPPNAPSTIAGKPQIGNNPLIHTRKLKNSIKAKITLRGKTR